MNKQTWKDYAIAEKQESEDMKYSSFQRKLVVTERKEKGRYIVDINGEIWTYDEKLVAFLMDEIHDETVKVMMCNTSEDEENLIEIQFLVEDYVLRLFIFRKNNLLLLDVANFMQIGPLKENLKGKWTDKIKEALPQIVQKVEKYLKEVSPYKLKFVLKEYETGYTYKLLRMLIEQGTKEEMEKYLECPIETFEFLSRRLKKDGIERVIDFIALDDHQIDALAKNDENYARNMRWQQRELKELIKK